MAKKQTRRTVSFARGVYDELAYLALVADQSVAQFITDKLRAAGVVLPETHHMAQGAVERAQAMRRRSMARRETAAADGWTGEKRRAS